MSETAIRQQVLEECAKIAEHYGEINFETCGDNILLDPLLSGEGFSAENIALSDQCSISSTIHSAKYHACIELAEQFRNLAASLSARSTAEGV